MTPRLAPSQNFRNPVGLLWRMLTSGKRAAYAALIHEGMRLLTIPLDYMLQHRESSFLTELVPANAAAELPPVLLVVGAPRSGTTLVYQTLARYLDVTYFSNLTSMFPMSPISGTHFLRWLPGGRTPDFENFYGQTAGWHGPNDGFQIWNRWLGDDRYIPRTDLTPDEREQMRRLLRVWVQRFEKPFLNKNNRNTGCLQLLAEVLPESRLIVVRRNPICVAQSLIKARADVQGDKSIGWGLHATDATRNDPLSYVDDVCDQILQIEGELDHQLSGISPGRKVELTYEGFCEDPHAALKFIAQSIPGVQLRTELIERELKPFQVSSGSPLTEAERSRLLSRLESERRVRRTENRQDLPVNSGVYP